MGNTNKYILKNEVFTTIYKKVGTISDTLFIINNFCENNKYSENYNKITPLIHFLQKESSQLFTYFINKKYAKKDEKIAFKM